jgi:hypothetical protein
LQGAAASLCTRKSPAAPARKTDPKEGQVSKLGLRRALRREPAESGPVVDRGKYLLVHERQDDGSWRRAVEMFNPDAAGVDRAVEALTQPKGQER